MPGGTQVNFKEYRITLDEHEQRKLKKLSELLSCEDDRVFNLLLDKATESPKDVEGELRELSGEVGKLSQYVSHQVQDMQAQILEMIINRSRRIIKMDPWEDQLKH